jgi:hypothetical protein
VSNDSFRASILTLRTAGFGRYAVGELAALEIACGGWSAKTRPARPAERLRSYAAWRKNSELEKHRRVSPYLSPGDSGPHDGALGKCPLVHMWYTKLLNSIQLPLWR